MFQLVGFVVDVDLLVFQNVSLLPDVDHEVDVFLDLAVKTFFRVDRDVFQYVVGIVYLFMVQKFEVQSLSFYYGLVIH